MQLLGTSCEWRRTGFDWSWGTDGIPRFMNINLTIINNDRELRRHITCVEESDFPVIDFSKYTLLLARGSASSYPSRLHFIDLQQHSSRNYVMNVVVSVGGSTIVSYWHVAIVTDKLDSNARVRLNVTNP